MPAPASLFIRGARFNGANARATNARVEFPHSQSGRPTDIHASTTNPLPKSRDPGQAGSSGAANRARKNQEVRDLREQLAAVAQEAVLLREQNATLTFSLGCSERRVAGLVTLTSQLYISYGDSSTGKSVAELSLAAKSAEVVRLTDDLAALAQAHEALKGHIAASETSATQRIAAKDREIADLQAKARALSDKQMLKKKDEELAAMETALNSLHSYKSDLLTQLRMRDGDIRSLKAELADQAKALAASETAIAQAAVETAAAQAAASDAAAAASQAMSEADTARAESEAAVTQAASEVAAARAASKAAAARASSQVASARAASKAATARASSELAAARAASEAATARASSELAAARAASEAATALASSELAAARAASEAATAEAVRMAAECEEMADLKFELEQLDTLRTRLFAHWCDTHDNLLDFKQACQLFTEGYRRHHELLHQLRFQPSILLVRPDLLAPSPEDSKAFELLNRASTCWSRLPSPERGESAPSEAAVAAQVAPSYAATTHAVPKATAALQAVPGTATGSTVAHWQTGATTVAEAQLGMCRAMMFQASQLSQGSGGAAGSAYSSASGWPAYHGHH